MTPTARRALLWVLVLTGSYLGFWATFFPASFYDSFPGPFSAWVAADGPFNEHLVRDVGTFHLGLAAASAAATRYADRGAASVVATGWIVSSLPHLGYHLHHLSGLGSGEAVAQVLALSAPALLAVPLLLPVRGSSPASVSGVRDELAASAR